MQKCGEFPLSLAHCKVISEVFSGIWKIIVSEHHCQTGNNEKTLLNEVKIDNSSSQCDQNQNSKNGWWKNALGTFLDHAGFIPGWNEWKLLHSILILMFSPDPSPQISVQKEKDGIPSFVIEKHWTRCPESGSGMMDTFCFFGLQFLLLNQATSYMMSKASLSHISLDSESPNRHIIDSSKIHFTDCSLETSYI